MSDVRNTPNSAVSASAGAFSTKVATLVSDSSDWSIATKPPGKASSLSLSSAVVGSSRGFSSGGSTTAVRTGSSRLQSNQARNSHGMARTHENYSSYSPSLLAPSSLTGNSAGPSSIFTSNSHQYWSSSEEIPKRFVPTFGGQRKRTAFHLSNSLRRIMTSPFKNLLLSISASNMSSTFSNLSLKTKTRMFIQRSVPLLPESKSSNPVHVSEKYGSLGPSDRQRTPSTSLGISALTTPLLEVTNALSLGQKTLPRTPSKSKTSTCCSPLPSKPIPVRSAFASRTSPVSSGGVSRTRLPSAASSLRYASSKSSTYVSVGEHSTPITPIDQSSSPTRGVAFITKTPRQASLLETSQLKLEKTEFSSTAATVNASWTSKTAQQTKLQSEIESRTAGIVSSSVQSTSAISRTRNESGHGLFQGHVSPTPSSSRVRHSPVSTSVAMKSNSSDSTHVTAIRGVELSSVTSMSPLLGEVLSPLITLTGIPVLFQKSSSSKVLPSHPSSGITTSWSARWVRKSEMTHSTIESNFYNVQSRLSPDVTRRRVSTPDHLDGSSKTLLPKTHIFSPSSSSSSPPSPGSPLIKTTFRKVYSTGSPEASLAPISRRGYSSPGSSATSWLVSSHSQASFLNASEVHETSLVFSIPEAESSSLVTSSMAKTTKLPLVIQSPLLSNVWDSKPTETLSVGPRNTSVEQYGSSTRSINSSAESLWLLRILSSSSMVLRTPTRGHLRLVSRTRDILSNVGLSATAAAEVFSTRTWAASAVKWPSLSLPSPTRVSPLSWQSTKGAKRSPSMRPSYETNLSSSSAVPVIEASPSSFSSMNAEPNSTKVGSGVSFTEGHTETSTPVIYSPEASQHTPKASPSSVSSMNAERNSTKVDPGVSFTERHNDTSTPVVYSPEASRHTSGHYSTNLLSSALTRMSMAVTQSIGKEEVRSTPLHSLSSALICAVSSSSTFESSDHVTPLQGVASAVSTSSFRVLSSPTFIPTSYDQTYLIILSGNCDMLDNKDDFSTLFESVLARLLSLYAADIAVRKISCGSVHVEFSVRDAKGRNITKKLEDLIEKNEFKFEYGNTTFVAEVLVVEPSLTTTGRPPTTTQPSAREKNIALILYILFLSLFATASVFLTVIFCTRFCCKRRAKRRSRRKRKKETSVEVELKIFSSLFNNLRGKVDYYGASPHLTSPKKTRPERRKCESDEDEPANTVTALLAGKVSDIEERRFTFADDDSLASVVFY